MEEFQQELFLSHPAIGQAYYLVEAFTRMPPPLAASVIHSPTR
jgi:hypothetical protein